MNRSYEAFAENLRNRAELHVGQARRSGNLRDIVRHIAMASTLEHAARKVCSGAHVNLEEIIRLIRREENPATPLPSISNTERSISHVNSLQTDR